MKRAIRSFLKLLFLPLILIFSVLMILTGYAYKIYYWIYEIQLTKFEKEIDDEVLADFKKMFYDAFKIWK